MNPYDYSRIYVTGTHRSSNIRGNYTTGTYRNGTYYTGTDRLLPRELRPVHTEITKFMVEQSGHYRFYSKKKIISVMTGERHSPNTFPILPPFLHTHTDNIGGRPYTVPNNPSTLAGLCLQVKRNGPCRNQQRGHMWYMLYKA